MPLTGPDILLYEQDGPIVTITMNREERLNALSRELRQRLNEAMVRFDDDPEARVAILTGAGEKSFSAGLDLREVAENQGEVPAIQRRMPSFGAAGGGGLEIWKPIIAAVNGFALAGGWLLAQSCDIRIAAEHAEFGITEAKWGRGTAWAVPLLWMMPLGVSLEVLFTADRFSAQRAYEFGFVNKVVPSADLLPAAKAMAERIAENAPLTIRAMKETMYRAMDVGRQGGIAVGNHIFYRPLHSEDSREGPRAFAEKRKPVWRGV